MQKWFGRFGEIPGLEYKSNPALDRTQLPGHDAVPKIDRYQFDGRWRESMRWPMKNGTSASPAKTWETKPRKDETAGQTVLRQLHEALELPGTLSDYHFALQGCHDALSRRAREEPWVLEEVERLCWLDIRLINQYPETITLEAITIGDEELAKLANERRGDRNFFSVTAFHQLIRMYEKEGYLREAREVAKIGEKFEQCPGKVEEVEERIRRVEAEGDVA